jgi:NADPH:quinone reductase-like Zn-dependent oxidoreductase
VPALHGNNQRPDGGDSVNAFIVVFPYAWRIAAIIACLLVSLTGCVSAESAEPARADMVAKLGTWRKLDDRNKEVRAIIIKLQKDYDGVLDLATTKELQNCLDLLYSYQGAIAWSLVNGDFPAYDKYISASNDEIDIVMDLLKKAASGVLKDNSF